MNWVACDLCPETIIGPSDEKVALVTISELQKKITDTRDAVELYRLYRLLFDKQIEEENVSGAEATIKLIVEHVRSSKIEREVSAFGIVDDQQRIALAKAGYLQIALLLDRLGEKESSRAKLAIAEKAIIKRMLFSFSPSTMTNFQTDLRPNDTWE